MGKTTVGYAWHLPTILSLGGKITRLLEFRRDDESQQMYGTTVVDTYSGHVGWDGFEQREVDKNTPLTEVSGATAFFAVQTGKGSEEKLDMGSNTPESVIEFHNGTQTAATHDMKIITRMHQNSNLDDNPSSDDLSKLIARTGFDVDADFGGLGYREDGTTRLIPVSGPVDMAYKGMSLLVCRGHHEHDGEGGDNPIYEGIFVGDNQKAVPSYQCVVERLGFIPAWSDSDDDYFDTSQAFSGSVDETLVISTGMLTHTQAPGYSDGIGSVLVMQATDVADNNWTAVEFTANGTDQDGEALSETVDGINVSGTWVGVFTTPFLTLTDTSTAVTGTTTGSDTQKIGYVDTDNVNGDANPAFVIYYILNTCLGISSDKIDGVEFQRVGAVLRGEDMGISFTTNQAKTAGAWVDEIRRHCDLIVYRLRSNGKWTIKLIREDYGEVGALTEISVEDDIIKGTLKLRRKSWEDCFTDINVKWTSGGTYDDAAAWTRTGQSWDTRQHKSSNPAVREALGYQKIQTLSFPMITRGSVMESVVRRLKRRYFFPLAVGSFRVPRSVFEPEPGDVFKMTSTSVAGSGFSDLVLRVLTVRETESKSQDLEISCMEDMFSIGTISTETIPEEIIPPGMELNYPVRWPTVKSVLGNHGASDSAVFVLGAAPEAGHTGNFIAGVENKEETWKYWYYSGTGTLTANFTNVKWADDAATFTVDNPIGLRAITNTDTQWQQANTLVIIDAGGDDWEMMSVKTIADNGDDTWTFTGLIRAVAGTEIQTFSEDDRVWVLDPNQPLDQFLDLFYLDISDEDLSQTVAIKARPVNSVTQGPQTGVDHTYTFRRETPPPPYIATVTDNGDGTRQIGWHGRNYHGTFGTRNWGQGETGENAFPWGWDLTECSYIVYNTAGDYEEWVHPPDLHTAVTRTVGGSDTYRIKAHHRGRYSDYAEVTG